MGNVYAGADWHGNIILAQKALSYMNEDDTLYYLGDAIDRGEDNVGVLQLLLADKRVIFIKGNHEHMMCDFIENRGAYREGVWFRNRGDFTFSELTFRCSEDEISELVKRLDALPEEYIYMNKQGQEVRLTHAGYTPGEEIPDRIHPYLVWNREHFSEAWKDGFENVIIVHGHTPVQDFSEAYYEHPQIHQYGDGHKYDIDLETYTTKVIALLNLDTWETTYFSEKE